MAYAQDPPAAPTQAKFVLAVSFALTLALYFIPFGRTIARPLVLFSTLVHELGHGFAAILVGGRFEALLMWADGSGVATWTALVGRIGHATIAAGGLVGPAIAAAICFMTGRRPASARACLLVMAIVLAAADILVVRTLFGVIYVALVALVFFAFAAMAKPWLNQLFVVFVGVQLALSVFSRSDYLFTPVAHTSNGTMASDTAQIAEALVLPYWFWGACCGLFSIAVLFLAFVFYLRD